jgi:hypothetical protein
MPSSCWICGGPADSAEHMVKASDVRSQFGHVTQHKRLFRHSKSQLNVPIKGAKAEALKFRPSLCKYCNNTRTQPHDRAWEELSEHLRKQCAIRQGLQVPLDEVFGTMATDSLLHMHLYFLKLFGCYGVEYAVPLPMNAFAVSILSGTAHPHFYLSFVAMPSMAAKPEISVGELRGLHVKGKLVGAIWHYAVGTIGVAIAYSEHGRPSIGKPWHPDDRLTVLTLA